MLALDVEGRGGVSNRKKKQSKIKCRKKTNVVRVGSFAKKRKTENEPVAGTRQRSTKDARKALRPYSTRGKPGEASFTFGAERKKGRRAD